MRFSSTNLYALLTMDGWLLRTTAMLGKRGPWLSKIRGFDVELDRGTERGLHAIQKKLNPIPDDIFSAIRQEGLNNGLSVQNVLVRNILFSVFQDFYMNGLFRGVQWRDIFGSRKGIEVSLTGNIRWDVINGARLLKDSWMIFEREEHPAYWTDDG